MIRGNRVAIASALSFRSREVGAMLRVTVLFNRFGLFVASTKMASCPSADFADVGSNQRTIRLPKERRHKELNGLVDTNQSQ